MKKLFIGLLFYFLFSVISSAQTLETWGGIENIIDRTLIEKFKYTYRDENIYIYAYLICIHNPKTGDPELLLVLNHEYALNPCPPLPEKDDRIWIKWNMGGKEEIRAYKCLSSYHRYRSKYMIFDGGKFYEDMLSEMEKEVPIKMLKLRYLVGGEPADFEAVFKNSTQLKKDVDYLHEKTSYFYNKLEEKKKLKERIKNNPTYNF